MDPGGKGGSGLCPDARFPSGQIRSILPVRRIALLLKKGAKLGMGYKKRT